MKDNNLPTDFESFIDKKYLQSTVDRRFYFIKSYVFEQ